MNKYSSLKRQDGVFLIEVIISALILAVAISAIMQVLTGVLKESAESRIFTHASNYANDKIDELRTYSTQDAFSNFSNGTDTTASTNTTLTRKWEVSEPAACPDINNPPTGATPIPKMCKQVQVTVTWSDTNGDTQTVQLTSYIAQQDAVRAAYLLSLY
ncbi:type IV pilus modification PilV family protein [Marinobacterium sediminicola]|uniref:Type IV pilus modification protein PilV n=1 Tax=Marinobacterium sediminicola TaxID=518898 RepID=A0ABY1S3F4_9GAMM|nr:hypothetical protein [Marinobacterium sediminicola]ULG68233.1 hypothetical protein LN244_11030 [Marinobacterium sediminicola]SMR77798.1 hypothetical protein SAMN04487964_11751 [Marinobacterium sediminicola]